MLKDVSRRRRVQEGTAVEEPQRSLVGDDGVWVHEDPRCDGQICYCGCSPVNADWECGCPPDPICECGRPGWACACTRM